MLIVTKLDRLGRNAMDVRATVERLDAMGVRVHCLALGGVDLTSLSEVVHVTIDTEACLEREYATQPSVHHAIAGFPTNCKGRNS